MSAGVTLSPSVRGIVLDIEGTTTPISFVHETLFSYAREHLRELLAEADRDDVRVALEGLRREWDADPEVQALRFTQGDRTSGSFGTMAYLTWLMDRDRKSPALKTLQGLVWQRGYQAGTLSSEVYPDVPRAFARWRADGLRIAIYSSGSVLAQRLLFAHTTHGDLTPFIEQYFDTGVGAKQSQDSYVRIAEAMECAGGELLFVSDIIGELHAARAAGIDTLLCVRDASADVIDSRPKTIATFDEIAGPGTTPQR
ncbi:MAG: acireductone synthase [Gemmatimonadota bacterium]